MPHTEDYEQAEAQQNRYNFMRERRKRLISTALWLLFICLVLIGLLVLVQKF